MIFINNGDKPHEIIDREEFKKRFGKYPEAMGEPGPHFEKGQALRQMRIKEERTIRELAKAMDVPASLLTKIELGQFEIAPATEAAYRNGLSHLSLMEKIK